MRVVRTVLGILLLTVGLPLLLVGGALWIAMQHRDAGGAYSGDIEEIRTQGYAVVVPDVDALLRRQAPFVRSEQTRLRLTAQAGSAPAFIGLAPPAEAARFLGGVAHTRVNEVRLARGSLPVRSVAVAGDAEPVTGPRGQNFWVRSGTGALEWNPATTRGQQLAIVVMSADGQPPRTVSARAEVRPGWLGSSTWGLLVLGSVTLLLGIVCLAWPNRTREIVYVVEPDQLPDVAARLGVSLPPRGSVVDGGAAVAGGAVARPATLAESSASGAVGTSGWSVGPPPATPQLAWPPVSAPASGPDAVDAAPQSPASPADPASPVPMIGVGPGVVGPRSARRRRANAADQASADEPIAPTGAGVAAAMAAGRRPRRPRGAAKSKPAKNDADQPVA